MTPSSHYPNPLPPVPWHRRFSNSSSDTNNLQIPFSCFKSNKKTCSSVLAVCKFYSNFDLKHQKTVHEGRKDFECDKCEKKFGKKSYLRVHMRTVHEGRKDFTCEKLHEGRQDYTCDKCEKRFGQKSHWVLHQKTVHEGRKDYACEEYAGARNMMFLREYNKCYNRYLTSERLYMTVSLLNHSGDAHIATLLRGQTMKIFETLKLDHALHGYNLELPNVCFRRTI
ncbi:unnamed protein product [Trichogramma brassicae]|uniref:C2H2-type domain-containing protein n=1 Tax=Trichogramma brassicae TaxID=86971 RepID=A0A6H5IXV9_9HYME|nr:unnamed protein product [Trichogramma brassicae]